MLKVRKSIGIHPKKQGNWVTYERESRDAKILLERYKKKSVFATNCYWPTKNEFITKIAMPKKSYELGKQ